METVLTRAFECKVRIVNISGSVLYYFNPAVRAVSAAFKRYLSAYKVCVVTKQSCHFAEHSSKYIAVTGCLGIYVSFSAVESVICSLCKAYFCGILFPLNICHSIA